jgi:hypothetical protein
MKKSIFSTIHFLFFCCCINGQINLVPNGGFDTISSCPTGPVQIYKAPPWIDPTGGSSDLLNVCSTNNLCSVPSNSVGCQTPYTGNGYAGLVTYASSGIDHREYIQVQLNDTLIAGKIYCVTFRVSRGDSCKYATDGMSAYFSNTAISCSGCFLPYTAQINNLSGNIISDSSAWTLIQGNFIAQGGEQFLTIGNFKTDANTNVSTRFAGASYIVAYYYIDDVSVVDCGWSGISSFTNQTRVRLFPNPTEGKTTLQYNLLGSENPVCEIVDLTGRILLSIPLDPNYSLKEIDLFSIAEGAYLYRIIDDAELKSTGTLIISR